MSNETYKHTYYVKRDPETHIKCQKRPTNTPTTSNETYKHTYYVKRDPETHILCQKRPPFDFWARHHEIVYEEREVICVDYSHLYI